MPEVVSTTVSQRIVHGASPAAPKQQRRKRKGQKSTESPAEGLSQTQTEIIVDIHSGGSNNDSAVTLPSENGAHRPEVMLGQAASLPEDDSSMKPSPMVQMIHKRLKATTKKITRISSYAETDPDKLDEDQKRNIKTLPMLEAVQKELTELKKAVETCESEQAQEATTKKIDAEKAEKARIAEAVSVAESSFVLQASEIFDILRLRFLLANGQVEDIAESHAIYAVNEAILGGDSEARQTVLTGLLSREGEIENISYVRLLEATQTSLAPRAPSVHEEHTEGVAVTPEPSVVVEVDDNNEVASTTPAAPFHFMQESELETAEVIVQQSLERKPVGAVEEREPEVNGHGQDSEIQVQLPPTTLDWAADEDIGLPSINSLHAKFGTSGSVTPEDGTTIGEPGTGTAPPQQDTGTTEVTHLPSTSTLATEPDHSQLNNYPTQNRAASTTDEEGFTQARGGRIVNGRGGRGGGGARGSFRGRYHSGGPGQGNDRKGSFRGGDRGGYRGGDRGFRGRGDWRADGEHRGRGGRGRGRTEYRSSPQQPLAAPA